MTKMLPVPSNTTAPTLETKEDSVLLIIEILMVENLIFARRSGEIASRMRDINEVNLLISQIASSYPSKIFVAFISLGFMFFYSWELTLVALSLALMMTLATLPFLPVLKAKTRNMLVLSAENQGVLVETFKGALVLKSTNAVDQFWEELQSRFGRLANIRF